MSHWLQRLAPRPDAPRRLFCFHHAGGGAAAFRLWPAGLPEFDVCAVQLPGRANRFAEAPFTDIADLVAPLAAVVAPLLDRPYALFGHSMGSAVAFALAQVLHAQGCAPAQCLFASGCQARHGTFPNWTMSGLSDARALEGLQNNYGVLPAEALASPELMEMLLPTLRADFALLDSFPSALPAPLPLPIVAIGGEHDPWAGAQRLQTWQDCTSWPLRVHQLPGGHFYLDDRLDDVLAIVRSECLRHAAAPLMSQQA